MQICRRPFILFIFFFILVLLLGCSIQQKIPPQEKEQQQPTLPPKKTSIHATPTPESSQTPVKQPDKNTSLLPSEIAIDAIHTMATPLQAVKTWFYFLAYDLNPIIDRLVASDYDLVVIEPVFTEKENEDYSMKEAVQRIHASPGRNVKSKIVLAYIDIGQAESYRYYWKDSWRIGNPDFIVGTDPDRWEDNYPVAFWRTAWQNIWFSGADGYAAQLTRIINAGFDGVYLDWVEAYSDENVLALAKKDNVDTVDEIKKFVKRIKEFGNARNPSFIVIAQNAAELAAHDDYLASIDGIAQEQTWFDGSALGKPEGDCPLPKTEEDVETPSYERSLSSGCKKMYDELPGSTLHTSSEEYIRHLQIAQRKGIPIFTVDYALKPQNIDAVYLQSRALGFVPFTSNRPLNQFVPPRYS